MDASNDVDFDAFWEEESRNKTRNRIRVGRQYQASVPALLKPGESDNRRLEDLETLRWRPESLSDQTIQEYLSMAKAVSVFSRTLEHRSHENLQSAIRGLTEFVMSHHPCHRDAGCRMSVKANWTNREAELLACAIDRCENANRKKLAEPEDDTGSECEDGADGEDGADDDDAALGDGDGAATSDNDHEGSAGSAAGTGCADADAETPVDENPPSEIKPIPARIIGRKSDQQQQQQQHLLSGSGVSDTDSSALLLLSGSGGGAAGADSGSGGNGRGSREGAAQTSHGGITASTGSGGGGAGTAPGQGSLKFYLGGQLILKLNHQAHQERKSWVEAPDNPAQVTSPGAGGGGSGGGPGGGGSSSSSSSKRRGGRKAQRTSTTSTGIAWPERGSPSQESSSSIDSHNSVPSHGPPTPGSTSTPTPTPVPATNSGSTAGSSSNSNNSGGAGSNSGGNSTNATGAQSSSSTQQQQQQHNQPIPLDLSSQQS